MMTFNSAGKRYDDTTATSQLLIGMQNDKKKGGDLEIAHTN
ncbi:Uncharacterized protein APZ42_028437 [Daphnia magna]|uniref:Uncharacterized protein n=1 Tax=Daphnia magna TaxID=35525 RepID=A0A164QI56_9CRUS|nr:Uncharacterized protein APZ42_028437 [Daphnia magna]